mmetsp:Transcript_2744/g.10883  ORF Transcript_2744/g.10883 Transcript_2744/m.10883 type:complete len:310 (+) Transcript_2744:1468-2397(+)
MYLAVRSSPIDRSSALRVLSFSSCFSQKNVCAARRDFVSASIAFSSDSFVGGKQISFTYDAYAWKSPYAYSANACACSCFGKSPTGGPTHTHASLERIGIPQSGMPRGSIAGAFVSMACFRAFAASARTIGTPSFFFGVDASESDASESACVVGHTSAMHSVTLPLNATRSAAYMGAATLAQGYTTTCITSSPPRPHATSRCIFRNAALVNTRFSMRTAVVGSPSSAMASTDLRSGAHGASATSGRARHARSSRFARRSTTPSGAPSRSQSLGPAEVARAATQPRRATRGPRDAPNAPRGRDAGAPVAA